MKKFTAGIILFLLLTPYSNIFSQLAKDSWSLGFGASYPRIVSIWEGSWSGRANYGGYISLNRHFSEHVAMRLVGAYSYMETKKLAGGIHNVRILATDVDLLYYFVPCEDLSPYIIAGFGGILFRNENSPQSQLDVTYYEYQYNLGIGAEWKFSDNWSLIGEGVYHTASTNKLDGHDDPGSDKGLFGGNSDTYIRLNAGFKFYFSKGEPSDICDLFPGVVEREIIREVPKEVIKEVIVEKPVEVKVKESRWVLVGVNFEFDKATLTPESYPFLLHAIQYLNENPDMRVEIGGHTDWIGSESYNQNLSERRARTVRDYLVSKGIDPGRLTTKGYGELMPVTDNNTPEGRALNRRIEFKIIE